MSVGFYVIAIMGCADGGSACTPVATLPARYQDERQCEAATTSALENSSEFDFPTLVAQCRQSKVRVGGRVTKTREEARTGR